MCLLYISFLLLFLFRCYRFNPRRRYAFFPPALEIYHVWKPHPEPPWSSLSARQTGDRRRRHLPSRQQRAGARPSAPGTRPPRVHHGECSRLFLCQSCRNYWPQVGKKSGVFMWRSDVFCLFVCLFIGCLYFWVIAIFNDSHMPWEDFTIFIAYYSLYMSGGVHEWWRTYSKNTPLQVKVGYRIHNYYLTRSSFKSVVCKMYLKHQKYKSTHCAEWSFSNVII